jgi:hypothetical protein
LNIALGLENFWQLFPLGVSNRATVRSSLLPEHMVKALRLAEHVECPSESQPPA